MVVAALALGAAGTAAAFLLAGGNDPDVEARAATTQTVVETVVTTPAPAVPAYIPETFRDTCKAAMPPTPDFDTSFICRPGDAAQVVRYSHAVSGPAMAAHLRRRLEAVGLAVGGPDVLIEQQGSCEERVLSAVEQWVASGRAGHDAVGAVPREEDDGRVVCYESAGRAHFEWTTEARGVYAHAYGPSYTSLLRWWRASAGPDT